MGVVGIVLRERVCVSAHYVTGPVFCPNFLSVTLLSLYSFLLALTKPLTV